ALQLLKAHYKVFRSILFNVGKCQIIESEKGGWGNIFLLEENHDFKHCGIVDRDYFSNHIHHITESQRHNTCLNRKIAIDAEGNIKNCPSMAKSYGNIKDTRLTDVVNNPEFQKLWFIHKDQISV